jgi:acetyltransferase EpsM
MCTLSNDIFIIGTGALGKIVLEVLKIRNIDVLGFIDENMDTHNKFIDGIQVLGGIDYFELANNDNVNLVIAIGNNKSRCKVRDSIIEKYGETFYFPNVIHPRAYVSDKAELGCGNIIMPGSVISNNSTLCDFSIINSNAILDHDVKIGSFSHVNVGVCIESYSRISDFKHIKLSSSVLVEVN